MGEVKYLECINCNKFFCCDVKGEKPEFCLNFEERKKEEDGKKTK